MNPEDPNWPNIVALAGTVGERVSAAYRRTIFRFDDEDVDPIYRTGQMLLDYARACRALVFAYHSGDAQAISDARFALCCRLNDGEYDIEELEGSLE